MAGPINSLYPSVSSWIQAHVDVEQIVSEYEADNVIFMFYNNSDPDNDYFAVVKNSCITNVGTVAYVNITTSTAGKSYYIYTQNPNLYLRQLILEYTAVE